MSTDTAQAADEPYQRHQQTQLTHKLSTTRQRSVDDSELNRPHERIGSGMSDSVTGPSPHPHRPTIHIETGERTHAKVHKWHVAPTHSLFRNESEERSTQFNFPQLSHTNPTTSAPTPPGRPHLHISHSTPSNLAQRGSMHQLLPPPPAHPPHHTPPKLLRVHGRFQLWASGILISLALCHQLIGLVSDSWIEEDDTLAHEAVRGKDLEQWVLVSVGLLCGLIAHGLLICRFFGWRFADRPRLHLKSIIIALLIADIACAFIATQRYIKITDYAATHPGRSYTTGAAYFYEADSAYYLLICVLLLSFHEIDEQIKLRQLEAAKKKTIRERDTNKPIRNNSPRNEPSPSEEAGIESGNHTDEEEKNKEKSNQPPAPTIQPAVIPTTGVKRQKPFSVVLHRDYLSPPQRRFVFAVNVFFLVIHGGGIMYSHVENWNIRIAVDFCLVSLGTIGYGNVTPKSLAGRLLLFIYFPIGFASLGFTVNLVWQVLLAKLHSRVRRVANAVTAQIPNNVILRKIFGVNAKPPPTSERKHHSHGPDSPKSPEEIKIQRPPSKPISSLKADTFLQPVESKAKSGTIAALSDSEKNTSSPSSSQRQLPRPGQHHASAATTLTAASSLIMHNRITPPRRRSTPSSPRSSASDDDGSRSTDRMNLFELQDEIEHHEDLEKKREDDKSAGITPRIPSGGSANRRLSLNHHRSSSTLGGEMDESFLSLSRLQLQPQTNIATPSHHHPSSSADFLLTTGGTHSRDSSIGSRPGAPSINMDSRSHGSSVSIASIASSASSGSQNSLIPNKYLHSRRSSYDEPTHHDLTTEAIKEDEEDRASNASGEWSPIRRPPPPPPQPPMVPAPTQPQDDQMYDIPLGHFHTPAHARIPSELSPPPIKPLHSSHYAPRQPLPYAYMHPSGTATLPRYNPRLHPHRPSPLSSSNYGYSTSSLSSYPQSSHPSSPIHPPLQHHDTLAANMTRLQRKKTTTTVQLLLAFLFVTGWMLISSLVFMFTEDWTYFQSFYFSYVTLTTIGYGDFYPSRVKTSAFFLWFVIFGLGAVLYLLSLIQEILTHRFEERIIRRQKLKEAKAKKKAMMKEIETQEILFTPPEALLVHAEEFTKYTSDLIEKAKKSMAQVKSHTELFEVEELQRYQLAYSSLIRAEEKRRQAFEQAWMKAMQKVHAVGLKPAVILDVHSPLSASDLEFDWSRVGGASTMETDENILSTQGHPFSSQQLLSDEEDWLQRDRSPDEIHSYRHRPPSTVSPQLPSSHIVQQRHASFPGAVSFASLMQPHPRLSQLDEVELTSRSRRHEPEPSIRSLNGYHSRESEVEHEVGPSAATNRDLSDDHDQQPGPIVDEDDLEAFEEAADAERELAERLEAEAELGVDLEEADGKATSDQTTQ